jgi:hypothetical protein
MPSRPEATEPDQACPTLGSPTLDMLDLLDMFGVSDIIDVEDMHSEGDDNDYRQSLSGRARILGSPSRRIGSGLPSVISSFRPSRVGCVSVSARCPPMDARLGSHCIPNPLYFTFFVLLHLSSFLPRCLDV